MEVENLFRLHDDRLAAVAEGHPEPFSDDTFKTIITNSIGSIARIFSLNPTNHQVKVPDSGQVIDFIMQDESDTGIFYPTVVVHNTDLLPTIIYRLNAVATQIPDEVLNPMLNSGQPAPAPQPNPDEQVDADDATYQDDPAAANDDQPAASPITDVIPLVIIDHMDDTTIAFLKATEGLVAHFILVKRIDADLVDIRALPPIDNRSGIQQDEEPKQKRSWLDTFRS
ncbi:hypothetical protein [Schleiferilactobacillus shenzhenensis]|uniref:Uncharacterized protein n=1 Tax=Schleiferilactobacillus shenzhenensis LY-73 TaxID=1231336 RepID=U4TUR9_9LACO|nr:hypothetical protein [Schleiferilactobacillus shenzhenensis]ERL65618.1 hypothetical protein L248_2304 [Schleiferilactobacillus shenzhenensis LY-73]